MEIPRRVGGDSPADARDPLELLAALRVGLAGRKLFGALRVAFGEANDRVRGQLHAVELLAARERLGIAQRVERLTGGRDLFLEIEESLAVDLPVGDGVPRRALLHELCEHPRFVGLFPSLGERREDLVSQAAPLPERDDGLAVVLEDSRVDSVVCLLAGVEDREVVDRVTGELGVGRHRLRTRPALADDEFVVADVDRLPGEDLEERRAAKARGGHPPLGLLHKLRENRRALCRDPLRARKAGVAQSAGPVVHPFSLQRSLRDRTIGTARGRSRVPRRWAPGSV